jgi:hypothetical protein
MASHWTGEIIATLKRIWETHSVSKIIEVINQEHDVAFSHGAVIGKLHRLGLYKLGTGIKATVTKPWFHPNTLTDQPARVRKPPRPKAEKPKVAAPKAEPIPFVPRVVESSPLHLTFEQITDEVCKYECTSNENPADFRFCGRPVFKGSYCIKCAAIVFVPPKPRKEAAYHRGRAA